jgi:Ca2+-binding EF-hand superfamily protein
MNYLQPLTINYLQDIDVNGDSYITKEEYRNYMKKLGVDTAAADRFFDIDDTNRDGRISEATFASGAIDMRKK